MFTKAQGLRDPAMTREGATGVTWGLDATASRVEITAKTYWGLVTVRGRFSGLAGRATVPADSRITAELTIDADSLDTGNDKRDKHLRSADFFDVKRHPYLRLAIDEVALTGTGTFTARGTMTVAGRTRPVSFDGNIAVSTDGCRAEVRAAAKIDRTTFGLDHSPLGMIRRTVKGSAHLFFSAENPDTAGAR